MTIKQQIENLKELNKKRTSGNWTTDGMDNSSQYIYREKGECKMIAQARGWGWLGKLGQDEAIRIQDANTKFIANAPQTADLALALYEKLEVAEKALEYYAANSYITGYTPKEGCYQVLDTVKDVAQQTLIEIKEKSNES